VAFDFNVRYSQEAISTTRLVPLKLLDVVQDITHRYQHAPATSHCRLIHQKYRNDEIRIATSVLQYIIKNPRRFGFQTVVENDKAVACYVSASHPDFRTINERSGYQFMYLVTTKGFQENTDTGTDIGSSLNNYVFVVALLSDELDKEQRTSSPNMGIAPLEEYICMGHYMADIARNGEKRLEDMITKVS
jgi:hypothetical protein